MMSANRAPFVLRAIVSVINRFTLMRIAFSVSMEDILKKRYLLKGVDGVKGHSNASKAKRIEPPLLSFSSPGRRPRRRIHNF